MAIAAPLIPAIRAWLSLVGIPKYQLATDQSTMAKRAAHRAKIALSLSSPKSTKVNKVPATLSLIKVITRTPKKLQKAAMRMAKRTGIALVETQVAIAFGASVQPLTKITPITKRLVIKKGILVKSSETK